MSTGGQQQRRPRSEDSLSGQHAVRRGPTDLPWQESRDSQRPREHRARPELRAHLIRHLLDTAGLLVQYVEGELAGGLLGGGRPLGAQGDSADPGTLETERLVHAVRGFGEHRGVGGRLGERTAAVVVERSA